MNNYMNWQSNLHSNNRGLNVDVHISITSFAIHDFGKI